MSKIERMMASSDLLMTFVAIAEADTLTEAAANLGRTQSAISVQLRKLEETLGTELFVRNPRGMALSPQGERLMPAARRALAEMRKAALLFDTPLSGRIRIGLPDDFNDTVLETALASFAAQNPSVEVFAQSGCTAAFPTAIAQGRLDVAVCSDTRPVPGEVLCSEPSVWACASYATLDAASPVPLAILDRTCSWKDMPARALDQIGRDWRLAYKTASFPSLCAAIRAGLAVGAMPLRCVDPAMRVLGPDDGLPPLPLSHRTIVIGPDAPPTLSQAMAQAIRRAVALNPVSSPSLGAT